MWLLLALITCGLLAGDGQCLASIGGGCPPSWSKWGHNCYKVTDKGLPWSDAKQECISLGSVMAVPQSTEEVEHLKISHFWIDCSYVGGTWVVGEGTTDGNWNTHQPSGDGNCAYSSPVGWNDVPCDKLFRTICKKPEATLHL